MYVQLHTLILAYVFQVERKIARLQRRVRSLSDSAISSDFTEPESTSVSPRSSRIPISDGKVEGVTSDFAFHSQPLPQDMFVAWGEEADRLHPAVIPEGRKGTGMLLKSLEDSGNIHDDQWLDTCAGMEGEGHGLSTDVRSMKPSSCDQWNGSKPAPDMMSATKDSWHEEQTQYVSALRKHKSFALPGQGRFSTPPTRGNLSGLQGGFPHRVVDAVLSVQPQQSHTLSLSPRRGKGLLGRRSKSLSSLTELALARYRSDFEENLLEQVKKIMQVARVRSSADLTVRAKREFGNASGADTVYDQDALAVEWEDGHFHPPKSGRVVSHRSRPVTEGISHAWLVSAERGALQESYDEGQKRAPGLSIVQGPQYTGLSVSSSLPDTAPSDLDTASKREQAQPDSSDVHAGVSIPLPTQQTEQADMESVTSITSLYGSSSVPSLSDCTCDQENDAQQEDYSPHSADMSTDILLSSGEIELANIHAISAAALRASGGDADSTGSLEGGAQGVRNATRQRSNWSTSRSSTTTSPSSPRRWNRRRFPWRHHSPEPDRCPSPGELILPKQTEQLLQEIHDGLDESETLEDLIQSGVCRDLCSVKLSSGQERMLLCKAMSMSCLGPGRYVGEEGERDWYDTQVRI